LIKGALEYRDHGGSLMGLGFALAERKEEERHRLEGGWRRKRGYRHKIIITDGKRE